MKRGEKTMNVLVINCGSSSLKYQLINSDTEEVLAKGLCERIGIDGRLVYQKAGLDKEITESPMPGYFSIYYGSKKIYFNKPWNSNIRYPWNNCNLKVQNES